MTSLANISAPERIGNPAMTGKLLPVRVWLFAVASLVFAMVVIGGATRLTGSGLSITEWQPILGVFPPQSEAAWQEAFEKYRHIPEYELVNKGMSLDGFKAIYWWEWSHRLIGRLIGFVFLLPFVYFLTRGAIPRRYIAQVGALFLLGGAQGALGWFMVKSGLSDRVDVSQYRLAAHLALAVAIGGYAFWLGLSLRDRADEQRARNSKPVATPGSVILAALIYLQIIAGAFVAGLKAGHASNTWPLMNGEIVPSGLDVFSPWYMNFFENPLMAQFAHRLLAYLLAIFAAVFGVMIWRSDRHLRLPVMAILGMILAQIALGVATIVYEVPLGIALAHQANAIVVFALALWALRRATDAGT
ncbi:MAG: COX15/CtaA family protein [Rhodomicrobium sp.]|nr:COX15/CtaA family protein [Rhodomicrobium sp.]